MEDEDHEFAVPAPRKPVAHEPPPSGAPPLSYDKPSWGGVATHKYGFEILKDGVTLDTVTGPKKDFITIGRLPLCDVQMEHPSISRYHAVMQFNADGDAFLYDLDSAHGTRVNKMRIEPRTYVPLHNFDQVRFGESTRVHIFETSKEATELEKDEQDDDEDRESTQQRRPRLVKRIQPPARSITETEEDEGALWGFGEDAVEEDDDEEQGHRRKGGKGGLSDMLDEAQDKEAVAEAKRRREELDILYGDSDDDSSFYDRTAKTKKSKKEDKAWTHDELVVRKADVEKRIAALEEKIIRREGQDKTKETPSQKGTNEDNEDDEDLDAYMVKLSKTEDGKTFLFQLQKELKALQKEHEQLVKLVRITAPDTMKSTKSNKA